MKSLKFRIALFGLAFLAMLWGYQLLLTVHAPVVFNDVLEDLSYGWYVPVFSLYVIWRERKEIAASIGAPSFWGVLLALPFLFLGFLGTRGAQIRFEMLGLIGLLLSLTWTFFGARTMRKVTFPVLFLLFCIPLHSFLDIVTIHLRLLAVSTAYMVLQGVGVDVVREGTMLLSPTGAFGIDVAEPCSGMRSLFAMMAISAGYAYFTQPTWLRRALLFTLSIPIVILGNIMRIFTIVLAAAMFSHEFATGFYHDYSGYVVFGVSIVLMVAIGGLITKLSSKKVKSKNEEVKSDQSTLTPSSLLLTPSSFILLPLFTFLFVAAMLYQARTVDPVLCELPDVHLTEIAGYQSQKLEPGEAALTSLPSDTRFDNRIYTAPDGNWYQVSMVFGGKSKSSIHRPELCLPSQGFQMMSPHTIEVGDIEWHRVTLAQKSSRPVGFSYTFFNQAGFRTSSHVKRIFRDVWDRSILCRIDRWVMVTVLSSEDDDRRLAEFLSQLANWQ